MECIATYPAYELANSRQDALLAADIDAVVWYVPTGPDQIYFGSLPIYALVVPSTKIAEAVDMISLVADENDRCIYGCPACGSSHVVERSQSAAISFWCLMYVTLAVPGIIAMISIWARGRPYRCLTCGTKYRLKP